MQIPVDHESAVTRKYPEGVAIVIAKDGEGKFNPITVCWLMRTSFDPPMLAVSIGKARHSRAAIHDSGEFVVSIASAKMSQDAVFFGSVSGQDIDKLAERGTETLPATKIDGVLLANAVANFECKLIGEVETGDHVLFIGQIVAAHMHEDPDLGGLYALGDYKFGGVRPA